MTLTVRGKAPALAVEPAPLKLKPAIALERITIALSTIHALLIDVECFQQDAYTFGQKIQRRAVKLNDPALTNHPGWNRAHAEWADWHIDQWWSSENARTAGVLLRSQCFAVECSWRDLTDVEREQVRSTVRHAAPGDGDALRQMETIRRLLVWRNDVLPIWGVEYDEVPF